MPTLARNKQLSLIYSFTVRVFSIYMRLQAIRVYSARGSCRLHAQFFMLTVC